MKTTNTITNGCGCGTKKPSVPPSKPSK